jgi:hypothetical protein
MYAVKMYAQFLGCPEAGMNQASNPVNPGRELCFRAFRETLENMRGREQVTEFSFTQEWLARMRDYPSLTANGWYDPPPDGIMVLSGRDDSEEPFRFASLRQPEYWPSRNRVIDWRHGIIYAYCSPLDTVRRLPADFGITLYFGSDPEVIAFYREALRVTREIVEAIHPEMDARMLFERAAVIIRSARMSNNVSSITHSDPHDIGHSFPCLAPGQPADRRLDALAISTIRNSRQYICRDDSWHLSSVAQFTVEPNLVSLDNPALPQFSPHYVVAINQGAVARSTDCDELFATFGLL